MYVAVENRLGLGESLLFETPRGATVKHRPAAGRELGGELYRPVVHLPASRLPSALGRPKTTAFFCPCHNGVFSPDGTGIGGPPGDAGQSLPRYPLKVEGRLALHRSRSRRDSPWAPGVSASPTPGPSAPGMIPACCPWWQRRPRTAAARWSPEMATPFAACRQWFQDRIPVSGEDFRELTNEPIPNHIKRWWFCPRRHAGLPLRGAGGDRHHAGLLLPAGPRDSVRLGALHHRRGGVWLAYPRHPQMGCHLHDRRCDLAPNAGPISPAPTASRGKSTGWWACAC